MANDLSKNIDIMFEKIVEGFDATNVSAKNVSMYKPEVGALSLGGQTFYRPQQSLTEVVDGRDVSSSYKDLIERTVPSTLTESHLRNTPLSLLGVDLNNPHVMKNMVNASNIMLSNKLDVMVADEIATKGNLVVVNSGNIDTYDDAAIADSIMLEQQVTNGQRCMFLNPRMSNNLAGNLASRGTMQGAPMDAYTRNSLPPIAGFDTFRVDYAKTLTGSSAASYAVDGGAQGYTPVAKDVDGVPVDNRTQTLTVKTGTGAAAGDCFTIAGVNSIGHINKQDTGQLKTFRIISVDSATSWTISPAIVPINGAADAQKAYANVTIPPADSAVVTAINTTTKPVSCFFEKSAVEIIHADFNTEAFSATGKKVRKSTTDSGVQIIMLSDSNVDTLEAKYRMFIWANVELLEYEAAGILLEGQV